MRRRINLSQLSPLRRGFLVGYRRARAKARAEMHALASDYDAALAGLEQQFNELALAYHRKCYADAVDEARIERAAMSPQTLLH